MVLGHIFDDEWIRVADANKCASGTQHRLLHHFFVLMLHGPHVSLDRLERMISKLKKNGCATKFCVRNLSERDSETAKRCRDRRTYRPKARFITPASAKYSFPKVD